MIDPELEKHIIDFDNSLFDIQDELKKSITIQQESKGILIEIRDKESMEFPEMPKTDLSITNDLLQKIAEKEIKEPVPTDMTITNDLLQKLIDKEAESIEITLEII